MLLLDLPMMEYGRGLRIQDAIVQTKIAFGGPDVLMLLEHPPTITLGKRGDSSDVLLSPRELAIRGIVVHRADRGGRATYHGPGQIVCYPLLHLRSAGLKVRQYVQGLEESVIKALAHFGVMGFRLLKMPGVWTESSAKIASIGVKISRGVTSHGLSLNVRLAHDPSGLIVTCGMRGARMTDMTSALGRAVDMAEVRKTLAESFSRVFGISLEPVSLPAALARFEPPPQLNGALGEQGT